MEAPRDSNSLKVAGGYRHWLRRFWVKVALYERSRSYRGISFVLTVPSDVKVWRFLSSARVVTEDRKSLDVTYQRLESARSVLRYGAIGCRLVIRIIL